MVITEFINANPKTSIIIISVAVTFFATLVTKWLTNQEHMKAMKVRQKELQKELKDCKDDECKMKEIQAEMVSITGKMMKSSFKPLLVTMVPFLILIYWLRGVYGGEEPLLASWIWWYLGASVASSIFLRKILKVA